MNKRQLNKIFSSDERIVAVREYPEGFVPNSYKYRCERTYIEHTRDGKTRKGTYDAKRSHGVGPKWVALSARGGRLASA